MRLKLDLLELGYVDADGNGFISYDELNDSIRRIYEDVNRHYVLSATAPPTKITLERYDVIENHIAVLGLIYQFPNLDLKESNYELANDIGLGYFYRR